MLLGKDALYNATNTGRGGRLFFKCTAVRGARRFVRATFLCEVTVRLKRACDGGIRRGVASVSIATVSIAGRLPAEAVKARQRDCTEDVAKVG
jgi:hypothetical protein